MLSSKWQFHVDDVCHEGRVWQMRMPHHVRRVGKKSSRPATEPEIRFFERVLGKYRDACLILSERSQAVKKHRKIGTALEEELTDAQVVAERYHRILLSFSANEVAWVYGGYSPQLSFDFREPETENDESLEPPK